MKKKLWNFLVEAIAYTTIMSMVFLFLVAIYWLAYIKGF